MANKQKQSRKHLSSGNRHDRQSGDFCLALVRNAADAIISMDTEGCVTLWNQAAVNMFGYTEADALGRNIAELIIPPQYQSQHASRLTYLLSGEPDTDAGRTFEMTVQTREGLQFPVELSMFLYAVEHRGQQITWILRDITERKKLDKRLQLYTSVLEDAVVGISLLDQEGRYLLVNRAYADLIGYTPEEIIGTPWQRNVVPEDRDKVTEAFDQLDYRNRVEVEARGIRKDGSVFHKSSLVIKSFDENDALIGYYCFMRDISHQKMLEESLRGAARYLDEIINAVADPIFVKDERHHWVTLNDALCRMLGYSREELLGKSDYDFFPSHEADVFWQKDEEVLQSGKENVNEETLTDAAGNVHTIVTKKTLYVDDQGRRFVVGVIRDVTELKKAEAEILRLNQTLEQTVAERTTALHRTIEREQLASDITESIYFETGLDEILQQTVNGVGRLANADRTLLWEYDNQNRTFKPLRFEYRRDETIPSLLGERMFAGPVMEQTAHQLEVIVIEDTENFIAPSLEDSRLMRQRNIKSMLQVPVFYREDLYGILRIHSVHEKQQWDEETLALLKGVAAQVAIAIRQAQYLQRLRDAMGRIQESEERFRTMADYSPVMVWTTDKEGNLTYLNKKWADFLGEPAVEQYYGHRWLDFIYPEDRDRLFNDFMKAFAQQRIFQDEFRAIRHDNGVRWIFSVGAPRYTPDGRFVGYVGSSIDITERRQVEEELSRAKLEAETASENKSQFLSIISHELRTPLNSILGFSEMLEHGYAGELNDKQKRYVLNVINSGQHLLDLVNDVLDISLIEHGKVTLHPQWVELQPLIHRLREIVQNMASRKHKNIHFNVLSEIDGLMADPIRLQQILLNLLSNAVKFNRDGGTIDLRIYKSDDGHWHVFEVQDSGIGIAEDKKRFLFQPFFQADVSYARRQEGTGLGLALAKHLVELHGGTIEVDSQLGVGTTFTFRLPVVEQTENAAQDGQKQINVRTGL